MGRGRVWLLLLCNASLATYSTAEVPSVYTEQMLPVENQPILSQLPPFQYASLRFRPESNDNNFKAYRSRADKSPHTLSLDSYPSTPEEAYSSQVRLDPKMRAAKDSLPTSELEENDPALYSTGNSITYQTPNLLPMYQYMQFRNAPFPTDFKEPFTIVVPDLRTDTPGKPIAVVPFKPPKRKPNRVSSQPPASPARPESPLAPSAPTAPSGVSAPLPAQSAPNTDSSAPTSLAPYVASSAPYAAPYEAPSAPYSEPSVQYLAPSAPYAAPSAPYAAPYEAPSAPYSEPSVQYSAPSAPYSEPSVQYSAPSAPYEAPSAPYSEPSVQYSAPSAPYAAPSAPYAAPYESPLALYAAPSPYATPKTQYAATLASEPSALYSPPGRAARDGPYAPAYPTYYTDAPGSEGDFRSGIFLRNSDIPKPYFIFALVRGRGLFDVDGGGGPLRLESSSYSYLSPENVPVYMLDVSRAPQPQQTNI